MPRPDEDLDDELDEEEDDEDEDDDLDDVDDEDEEVDEKEEFLSLVTDAISNIGEFAEVDDELEAGAIVVTTGEGAVWRLTARKIS